MKATRAAKAACRTTGTMMAPWIAPFIKRRASGHLQEKSIAALEGQRTDGLPSRFMASASRKRESGFPDVVSRRFDPVAVVRAIHWGSMRCAMANWYRDMFLSHPRSQAMWSILAMQVALPSAFTC